MTGPLTATLTFVVGEDDTAEAVGSGTLPVLGTPRLLAWCEAATCAALEPALAAGRTTVGTRVSLEHLAPSAVGQQVEVTASEVYADGRLHRFTVAARNVAGRTDGADRADGADTASGPVICSGEITRVVVDSERFMGRISSGS